MSTPNSPTSSTSSTALVSNHLVPTQPLSTCYQRIQLTIEIYLLKFIFGLGVQFLKLPGIRDTSLQPTFTKIYPCQPKLKNRIFIPRSHKDEDGKLPLYIDIHGGGYALTEPCVDDPFCSDYCNKHNMMVISLDYPKAPAHRFPVALEALVDLVDAVLSDSSLPIDKSKVAIGGCSAGGNLALGVCQAPTLQGKLHGVVACYAPMDFSVEKEVKFDDGKKYGQVLPRSQMLMFSWGYVPAGQNLKDPRLSPIYAERETLPKNICLVGCELDFLCGEDEIMAQKMTGGGGEGLVWEKNGVRWEKVLGEDHAFDNIVAFGEKKRRMRKRGQEMRDAVAEWLLREVYV